MTAEDFQTGFVVARDLPAPDESSPKQIPPGRRRAFAWPIVAAIVAFVVVLVVVALIVFNRSSSPHAADLRPFLVSAPPGTSPCTDHDMAEFRRISSAADRAKFHNATKLSESGILGTSDECWQDQTAGTSGEIILMEYDRPHDADQAFTAAMTSFPADVSGADVSAIPGIPGETFTTRATTLSLGTYTMMWVLSHRGDVLVVMTIPVSPTFDAAAAGRLAAQQYERLAAVQ